MTYGPQDFRFSDAAKEAFLAECPLTDNQRVTFESALFALVAAERDAAQIDGRLEMHGIPILSAFLTEQERRAICDKLSAQAGT